MWLSSWMAITAGPGHATCPARAGTGRGLDAARSVVRRAANLGIDVLTLFAFSTENWARAKREVSPLLTLLRQVLTKNIAELDELNIRLRIVGGRERFGRELCALMEQAEAVCTGNTGMQLVIAANYGGRWDIAHTCRLLAQQVSAGELDPDAINEQMVDAHISTAEFPPPDLCIRTGGDHRLSNFLLWQLAYTELYFTNTFWPDFDAEAFNHALQDFATRQRRFGRRLP